MEWCVRKFNLPYTDIQIDPACNSLREELLLIGYPASCADNNGKEHIGGRKGIEVGIERAQNALNDGRLYLLETNQYGHADFYVKSGYTAGMKRAHPLIYIIMRWTR